jgi:hypothetical protein
VYFPRSPGTYLTTVSTARYSSTDLPLRFPLRRRTKVNLKYFAGATAPLLVGQFCVPSAASLRFLPARLGQCLDVYLSSGGTPSLYAWHLNRVEEAAESDGFHGCCSIAMLQRCPIGIGSGPEPLTSCRRTIARSRAFKSPRRQRYCGMGNSYIYQENLVIALKSTVKRIF